MRDRGFHSAGNASKNEYTVLDAPAASTDSQVTETASSVAVENDSRTVELPSDPRQSVGLERPEKQDLQVVGAPQVEPPTIGMVRAVILADVVMIVVNTIMIATTLPLPVQNVHLRGLHHFYDVGQHLAVAMFAAACVASWQRFGSSKLIWQRVALGVISLGLAIPILRPDLYAFAHRRVSLFWAPFLLALVTFLGSLGVVVAADVGRRLGGHRRRLAWLAVAFGVLVLGLNHRILRRDYPGVHFHSHGRSWRSFRGTWSPHPRRQSL